jgi:CheY-like chemotaxis protein
MEKSALRVAYVDDDPDMRAMVALSLKHSHGCPMLTCATGAQAVREVPAFQPDVIMLDYLMPGMNGFQTLDALAHIMDLRGIKIVMTSGVDLTRAQHRVRADALLHKPFDLDQLGQVLEDLCSR